MSFKQFDLMAEVQPEAVPTSKLFKWKSNRTGMQVVLIKRQSPSVQAHITVASEANDNSGCPHTLEHIVFMGSKKFPYRGFLDKVAVQQLSSINAFTEQDKTCYTLTSAGYEGFLNTLPVFLDNILHATVEDSACLTEVYHVDGKGEEKGVVFCEMQGHENTEDTIMLTEMQRLLYNPDSGYATNTGGKLSALRTLSSDTIRQYHRDVYRPDNLLVLVSGDLEPEQLLSVVSDFDSDLVKQEKMLSRPFIESQKSNAASPLKHNVYSTVEFPDSSEDSGQVLIAWLGTDVKDVVSETALEVVKIYLTMQNAGKLERKFVAVDKDKAIASDVYASIESYLTSLVNVWFSNVPSEMGTKACEQIVDYLENGILEDLDFDLLKESIKYLYDGFVESAENSWQTLGNVAVVDFIYGDDSTFVPWIAGSGEFDILKSWSLEDWIKLITDFVVKPAKVCIFGKPSKELSKKIDKDKKQMRKEIKKRYDIVEQGRILEEALKKNDEPVPDELLQQYPVPSFANIPFISTMHAPSSSLCEAAPWVTDAANNELSKLLKPDNIEGLAINFEQVKSQFVNIEIYITPQKISPHLYPLISSVMSRIFAMPMKLDDGKILSADEVIRESNRDLRFSSFEVCSELREFVTLNIGARMENYEKAMEWLQRIMFNVVFDEENVAVALARYLKGLAEYKRTDTFLLDSSVEGRLLGPSSLRRCTDMLISEDEVTSFEHNIPNTVEKVRELYKSLFRKENMRILVVADFFELAKQHGSDHIVSPWNSISSRVDGHSGKTALLPIVQSSDYLTADAKNPPKEAIVTVSAATDSTNMIVSTPCLKSYKDDDLIGLAVIASYLESLEGPLSVAVRGSGLAYGVFISASVQLGNAQCYIYESTDAIAAYHVCKQVISDIAEGKIEISATDVSSAAATVVCNMASLLATPAAAAREKFLDVVLKEYGTDRVDSIIKKVEAQTPSNFVRLLKKYFLPIFDVDSSMAFVVAPVSEEEQCRNGLASLGYSVTVKEAEFEDDSGDEISEDEDDDDDDDDESESESDSAEGTDGSEDESASEEESSE